MIIRTKGMMRSPNEKVLREGPGWILGVILMLRGQNIDNEPQQRIVRMSNEAGKRTKREQYHEEDAQTSHLFISYYVAFSLESQLKQHENLLSFQTANRSRRPTLISLPEDQIDHNVNSKKESWQGQSSGKSSKGSLPDSRDSLKLMSYLDPESDKEPSTLEEEAEKKVDEDMDEDDLDLPMYQDTSFYLLPLLKKHENLLSFQTANRSRRPTLVISFTEDERDHTDHHDTGKRQQSRRSSVKSLKGSQPGSKELHWPKPISYFDPRPTNEPSTSKEKEKERVEENEDQDEDQDEEDPPVYRDTDSKMFAKSILKSHNDYRQKHGCPPIKICQKLNHDAQQYADALATTKVLKHSSESSRGNCGENLSWASYDQPGHEVADRWYSEIRNYDYKSPGFTPESGHFTAMIWKGTKKMGVGKASANDGSSYVVARYFPAGNIVNPGLFEENVPRPKT
ncbi:Golgi-associated plant pathogenesis-related protein 1 isoform X1 [Gracilinanus agilis]|uniref:Golgi-associated plant pathogenesis-related protein 1 isoform X1 n=1 Tax=Gracilinanus agilis TaxID=191870 RepID=UPI001CFD8CE6|nr:Golgi-associated plant pathogenesis-related protein 1 isoform X1 [Gracilinanus agilis]